MTDDLRARLEGNKNLSIGPAFAEGFKEEWVVVEEQDGLETLAHIPDYYYSEEQERLARDIARAITDLPVVSRALLAVLDLHRESGDGDCIHACGDQVQYPCATVRAIEEAMKDD